MSLSNLLSVLLAIAVGYGKVVFSINTGELQIQLESVPDSALRLSELMTIPKDLSLGKLPSKALLRNNKLYPAVKQLASELTISFTKVQQTVLEIKTKNSYIDYAIRQALSVLFKSNNAVQISANRSDIEKLFTAANEIASLSLNCVQLLEKPQQIAAEFATTLINQRKVVKKEANGTAESNTVKHLTESIALLSEVEFDLDNIRMLFHKLEAHAASLEDYIEQVETFFKFDGIDQTAFLKRRFAINDSLMEVYKTRAVIELICQTYFKVSAGFVFVILDNVSTISATIDPDTKMAIRLELHKKSTRIHLEIEQLVKESKAEYEGSLISLEWKINQTIWKAAKRLFSAAY